MNKILFIILTLIGATAVYASGLGNASINDRMIVNNRYGIMPQPAMQTKLIDQGVVVQLSGDSSLINQTIKNAKSDVKKYYSGVDLITKQHQDNVDIILTSADKRLVKHLQDSKGQLLQFVISHRNILDQNYQGDYLNIN